MRRLLLAALTVLITLAPEPIAGQTGQTGKVSLPVISVTRAEPRRAVYLAALEVLERGGYPFRLRSLDEALLTDPAFSSPNPGAQDTASMVFVEIGEEGDSTRLTIHARVVRGDGTPADTGDAGMARVLMVETMISMAVDSALGRLGPGDGKPDRRENSAIYAYGRRNPVRVGGEPGNGVAEERRYLDRLRGPAGQPVRYRRLGSCCDFSTPHAQGGGGRLDAYELTYDGLERPVVIYIDMYTPPASLPPPPEGFTAADPSAAT